MDISVICTYRCNSKCSMCHIWKNPTSPEKEVQLNVLQKLPLGVDNLNITGGEPTLRKDIVEIVDVLYPKAKKLEISSNGLHSERLEPIIKKYPDIKIRFSLEGIGSTNNAIRGETDGFEKKFNGLMKLKELGGTDLGFASTIQDDNIDEIIDIYNLTKKHGFELATSALHNGFQFHKSDNYPYDRVKVAKKIEELIIEMLKTNSIKNWFRAYLNLGLIEKVLGHPRLIVCTAAKDFAFVDPWSDVYACNVRPDLKLGNLKNNTWDEIFYSDTSDLIRQKVSKCKHNCWMVGSARTAMRHPKFTSLPKLKPLNWVIQQKLKVLLGIPINFERWIDYRNIAASPKIERLSYLETKNIKRTLREDSEHYFDMGEFTNK